MSAIQRHCCTLEQITMSGRCLYSALDLDQQFWYLGFATQAARCACLTVSWPFTEGL
jgi:hypothetical protein